MRTCGSVNTVFVWDSYGKDDAYSDESQDGIKDVEHAECSSLVRHGSLTLHLTLEADCEADEATDEELL